MQKSRDISGTPRTAGPRGGAKAAPRRNSFGVKSLSSFVPSLTRKAFERYGFSAAVLITEWAEIVGPDLAVATSPERLRWPKLPPGAGAVEDAEQGRPGATLFLKVEQGKALDIQYRSRQIVERINAYFGYRAVADLRIVQVPMLGDANGRMRTPPPTLGTLPKAGPPPAEVLEVKDPELRAALERMASGLQQRSLTRSRG